MTYPDPSTCDLKHYQEHIIKQAPGVIVTQSRDRGSRDYRPTSTYYLYYVEDGAWQQDQHLSGVRRDVLRAYRGYLPVDS